MVYILLAGGIFNAVLVPQLVRRIKEDADGGDAYASRMITLSALFLGVVTILLIVAAPLLLRLYLDGRYLDPDRVAQLESIVALTRWCLPQVFFYGMYVLVGQVLNARGRFGPMMWAPIANNLLSVLMLVTYLALLRTDRGRRGPVRGAQHQPGGPARPRLDAGDRGPVPRPRALPARLGVHLPTPLRLPRPRAGEDAVPGQLDGAVRGRHPGGVPRRGQARVGRHGRTAATAPATSSTPTAC